MVSSSKHGDLRKNTEKGGNVENLNHQLDIKMIMNQWMDPLIDGSSV
jgi:hypothetical protein